MTKGIDKNEIGKSNTVKLFIKYYIQEQHDIPLYTYRFLFYKR